MYLYIVMRIAFFSTHPFADVFSAVFVMIFSCSCRNMFCILLSFPRRRIFCRLFLVLCVQGSRLELAGRLERLKVLHRLLVLACFIFFPSVSLLFACSLGRLRGVEIRFALDRFLASVFNCSKLFGASIEWSVLVGVESMESVLFGANKGGTSSAGAINCC